MLRPIRRQLIVSNQVLPEKLKLAARLWEAGVRTEFAYDTGLNLDEQFLQARTHHAELWLTTPDPPGEEPHGSRPQASNATGQQCVRPRALVRV